MNKINKLIALSALVFLSLTSCLKDKDYDDTKVGLDLSNAPKIIELGFSSSQSKSQVIGLDFVDATINVEIVNVRLAATDPAPEDIVVQLDTTGTEAKVQSLGDSNFNRLPSLYTLTTGLAVTIPKGKREATLVVKTNASKFNPSAKYGINFKLKSVSGSGYTLSNNFNTFYTVLGAKNSYDGVYKCDFTNYHPTLNAAYVGTSTTVHLVTTGPNSNKIFWPTANAFANPALLNGALNFFGSQEPEYTFNPTTNAVTVQNAFSNPTTLYTMNSTHPNNYDPVARVVNVRWGYSYVGGNFTLGTSREWTQKLTYLGPR
jgi:hypothetical protein